MTKNKNSGWDNPKWPEASSKKRKTSNTPTKLYDRSNMQKGANTKMGISSDKHQKAEYHDSRAYSDNLPREHSGKKASSNKYYAKKEAAGNEYPEACNLTKKDIFEEYPDATVICSTCGFMLEGDTPTIYIDCNRCARNEIEIKMMKRN